MSSSRLLPLLAGFLLAGAASAQDAAPASPPEPPPPRLGWVPSPDEAITRDLEAGLVLGLEQAAAAGGPKVVLARGESEGPWAAEGQAAVRLATEGALALVSPPERATAHLMSQVATRAWVPLVTTSRVPSVTGTGSTFTFRVVPRGAASPPAPEPPPFDAKAPEAAAFAAAFEARHGRAPTAWAAAGYDAARAACAGLAASGGRGGLVLRDALRALPSIPGATGPFRFGEKGDRAQAEPPPSSGAVPPAAPPADPSPLPPASPVPAPPPTPLEPPGGAGMDAQAPILPGAPGK